MAEQGMHILFVPYWTDTKNSYLRVRRCAQARAIENEVLCGPLPARSGNLPAGREHGYAVFPGGRVHAVRLRVPP